MNKIVSNVSLLVFLFFSFCLFYPVSSHAIGFANDFTVFDESFWDEVKSDSDSVSIIPNDIILIKKIDDNNFPFLFKNITSNTDTVFEVKLKFRGGSNYGAGVVLSDQLVPYGIETGVGYDNYIFAIWSNQQSKLSIGTILCPDANDSCVKDKYNSVFFDGDSDTWYSIRITYIDGFYKVFVDGIEVFKSKFTERKVTNFWIGSPEHTGDVIWPEILVDSLAVNEYIVQSKNPIIVLPGMGASWDFKALLDGTQGTNWTVPEFVTIYDSLVKSFENDGYTKDKDLFIFSFDWRKSLDQLSDELNAFIIGHIDSNTKINFVGHSMGGLVSRIYVQKYGTDKVSKLITLGSPHQGSVEMYGLWEGASLLKNVWWEKAALETMIQINQKPYENRVETLRSQAPSVRDLLPTYNFLYYNGVEKNWNDLLQKNTYLSAKNLSIGDLTNTLFAYAGNGEDTKTKIRTEKRSAIDALFGMWEDGKPISNNPFVFVKGDGTVDVNSATMNFSSELFNVNHAGLPESKDVIEKIFDNFGLDKSKVEIVAKNNDSNLFTAILRSPGRLEVCNENGSKCDENRGVYIRDSKLFMEPGYSGEKLRIRVYEEGLGAYKLHLANMNQAAIWNVISGKISRSGQIDNYLVTNSNGFLTVLPDLQTSINQLDLCKAEMEIVSPGWDKPNNIGVLSNQNSSELKRTKAVLVLRNKLGLEIFKANKKNDNKAINSALMCWESIDSSIKNSYLNKRDSSRYSNIEIATYLSKFVEKLISTTKNVHSIEVFNRGKDKITEAELFGKGNKKLGIELSNSAEALLLIALGLR